MGKPQKALSWLQRALTIICSGIFVGAVPLVLAGQENFPLEIPLGLDEDSVVIPQDNSLTTSKVHLGKLLFFDKRLSPTNTIACANCHKPELAFTDGQPVSMGIHRRQEIRNAPASINRIFGTTHLWDGLAATLEEQ
ncbi:MAG: cytochrome-c peroxidase, partial [Nitrospirota bacterium]